MNCPACRAVIADDSRFCGMCRFRLVPIPAEKHRKLSESLPPLRVEPNEEVIPLTRPKGNRRQAGVDEVGAQAATRAAAAPSTVPADPHASTEQDESRRYPRFPLRVEVSYGSEHNFFMGFVENVSNGGLFVATHQLVEIGDLFELTFTVPGLDRACTAVCRVRWVREYDPNSPDGVPGMGVQFSQLDPDARAAIELFIQHREPIFYDD